MRTSSVNGDKQWDLQQKINIGEGNARGMTMVVVMSSPNCICTRPNHTTWLKGKKRVCNVEVMNIMLPSLSVALSLSLSVRRDWWVRLSKVQYARTPNGTWFSGSHDPWNLPRNQPVLQDVLFGYCWLHNDCGETASRILDRNR